MRPQLHGIVQLFERIDVAPNDVRSGRVDGCFKLAFKSRATRAAVGEEKFNLHETAPSIRSNAFNIGHSATGPSLVPQSEIMTSSAFDMAFMTLMRASS